MCSARPCPGSLAGRGGLPVWAAPRAHGGSHAATSALGTRSARGPGEAQRAPGDRAGSRAEFVLLTRDPSLVLAVPTLGHGPSFSRKCPLAWVRPSGQALGSGGRPLGVQMEDLRPGRGQGLPAEPGQGAPVHQPTPLFPSPPEGTARHPGIVRGHPPDGKKDISCDPRRGLQPPRQPQLPGGRPAASRVPAPASAWVTAWVVPVQTAAGVPWGPPQPSGGGAAHPSSLPSHCVFTAPSPSGTLSRGRGPPSGWAPAPATGGGESRWLSAGPLPVPTLATVPHRKHPHPVCAPTGPRGHFWGPGLTLGLGPVDPICLLGWPRHEAAGRSGPGFEDRVSLSAQRPQLTFLCLFLRLPGERGDPPPPGGCFAADEPAHVWAQRGPRAAGAQGSRPSRGTAWRCPRLARARAARAGPAGGRSRSTFHGVLREPSEQRHCVVRGSRARPVRPTAPCPSPQGDPLRYAKTQAHQGHPTGGRPEDRGRGLAASSHSLEAKLRPWRGSAGEAGRGEVLLSPLLMGFFQLPLPWDAGSLGTWRAPRSWSWPAVRWPGGRAMNTE